jgi:NADH-quinone oxidoreductase subunit J
VEGVVFGLVALGAIASAVGLVVRPNPLHGALYLVANLSCVAVLFLVLGAEFLALTQVIVYAGAIMVLFVFAIFVLIPTRAETDPDRLWRARRGALPVAAVLGLVVVAALAVRAIPSPRVAPRGGTAALGGRLFTDYLVPFEITSILLLAALVGALVLSRRRAA